MSSLNKQIAAAVTGVLNARKDASGFPVNDFTAVRVDSIDYEQESTSLLVLVCGRSQTSEPIARDTDEDEFVCEVYLTKKLAPNDAAGLDQLVELAEAMKVHLRKRRGHIDVVPDGQSWTAVEGAEFQRVDLEAIYDFRLWREKHRFSSQIKIYYAIGDDGEDDDE